MERRVQGAPTGSAERTLSEVQREQQRTEHLANARAGSVTAARLLHEKTQAITRRKVRPQKWGATKPWCVKSPRAARAPTFTSARARTKGHIAACLQRKTSLSRCGRGVPCLRRPGWCSASTPRPREGTRGIATSSGRHGSTGRGRTLPHVKVSKGGTSLSGLLVLLLKGEHRQGVARSLTFLRSKVSHQIESNHPKRSSNRMLVQKRTGGIRRISEVA